MPPGLEVKKGSKTSAPLGDARAGIGDRYLHGAVAEGGGDDELRIGGAGLEHGVDAVADQVDHDLLHLDAVGGDLGQALGEVEAGTDLAVGGADQRQPRRVEHDLVDDDGLAFGGAARDEAPQAADHLAGAVGLSDGLLHVLRRAPGLIRTGLDQAARCFAEVGDSGEGLIELVDDHRGNLAHRR